MAQGPTDTSAMYSVGYVRALRSGHALPSTGKWLGALARGRAGGGGVSSNPQ